MRVFLSKYHNPPEKQLRSWWAVELPDFLVMTMHDGTWPPCWGFCATGVMSLERLPMLTSMLTFGGRLKLLYNVPVGLVYRPNQKHLHVR
jgi:hypothetical protein